jgi:hypothetical protein
MYRVTFYKEDLSNQIANNKFRYRWELNSQKGIFVIELITTLEPVMQRLYINNQMV